jgi:hypothetical protein
VPFAPESLPPAPVPPVPLVIVLEVVVPEVVMLEVVEPALEEVDPLPEDEEVELDVLPPEQATTKDASTKPRRWARRGIGLSYLPPWLVFPKSFVRICLGPRSFRGAGISIRMPPG